MKKLPLILSATLLVASASQSALAAKVTPFQGSIAEETFQTEIVKSCIG
jgi:glycine betaine/proline transport system substrate-binding protein